MMSIIPKYPNGVRPAHLSVSDARDAGQVLVLELVSREEQLRVAKVPVNDSTFEMRIFRIANLQQRHYVRIWAPSGLLDSCEGLVAARKTFVAKVSRGAL